MKHLKIKLLLFTLCVLPIPVNAIEKEVILNTGDGNIYGTLLTPDLPPKANNKIFLFICGSGPTDRDGNNPQMKNNSIRFLAEDLCNEGLASLRYDKRGIAQSTKAGKTEEKTVFTDYVKDASEWVNLLAKDYKEIIIIGHSEGSLIGMKVASSNPKVSRFISLAGAGTAADEILKEQLSEQPEAIKNMAYPTIDSLKAGRKVDNVNPMLNALFRPSIQGYLISWFAVDPVKEIAKLKIPVLIIQGDKDIQVPVKNAELLASAQSKATKVIIPNTNHVLKNIETTDKVQQVKTYMTPTLKNDPAISKTIIEWIK